MKTLLKNLKALAISIVILLLSLTSFQLKAQDKEVKISDNANITISENTYFKIPGNITLGQGSSGNLVMKGNTFEATGQLNINANSKLDITSGTFTVANTNFNSESTVTYDGENQEIKNWSYGHLILNGTGSMSILGDVTTPTTCNTLTINNTGNSLIIPETKALTVDNNLTNNAGVDGIIINSSATGDGSLISYTTNTNATVKRYITGTRWHYLSSPIDGAPLNLFNTNNFLYWDATMEWDGLGDYNPWKSFNGTNLNNVEGYAYYYYEHTIEYQGFMNVGNYSFNLYKSATGDINNQGWNLIGNPYTSILDWDAAVADGAVPIGAENAIYYFDDETGDGAQSNYRYYVPSSGGTYGVGTQNANGNIPIGQGFFIKTNTNNVTLNINKSYRVHAVQEFYKQQEDNIFTIEIANEYSDETIIRIVDGSSYNFDSEYDARKLFANDIIPQIYCLDGNNQRCAINSIPEINKNTIIPLGIKAEKGQYTISLKNLGFSMYDIYLVDNNPKSCINLSQNKSYKFTYYGEEVNDRFHLIFQSLPTNLNSDLSTKINIYPNPTSDFIKFSNTSSSNFETIQISSANGKLCYNNNNAQNINKIDLSSFADGIYFIQIKLNNGKIFHDKIIKH